MNLNILYRLSRYVDNCAICVVFVLHCDLKEFLNFFVFFLSNFVFLACSYWPTIGRQALPMLGPLAIYITPPWAQAGLELTTS